MKLDVGNYLETLFLITMDPSTTVDRANNNDEDPELTPLEQEVLDEYAKLAGNLETVSHIPTLTISCIASC